MRKIINIILCLFPLLAANVASAGEMRVLTFDERDVINAISQEFVERGMVEGETVDVELFGGKTDFQIENAEKAKIIISNLKVDETLGRFSCNAEIFADGRPYASSSLQGRYFQMTEVWVPRQNIAKGEIISEDMLAGKSIRASRLKPSMVTEKEKLKGLEAKKSLKEGKIINDKDVGARILIKRNDIVTAVYRTDKMQITAKAAAQQEGALGDRIELQNIKTRKVLTGVVQDASTVVIEQ